jgi:hypothetical protein
MSETTDRYNAAYIRLEAAKAKAEALGKIVMSGGNGFRYWRWSSVDGERIAFRESAGGTPTRYSINGQTWPSVKQIAETLSEYHTALSEANSILSHVPPDERKSLKSPEP